MRVPGIHRRVAAGRCGDHAGAVEQVESRRDIAGRQHAASPSLWPSQQAGALWRLLDGSNDEDSTAQVSVLTFLQNKRG